MRKIRLDLESLAVDSFATTREGEGERGTVIGRQDRPNNTAATVCWGVCGGYGQTEVGSCGCPSDYCVYPTAVHHSCPPGYTYGEHSCWCLYPDTDVRMCCTEAGCSGGGMC